MSAQISKSKSQSTSQTSSAPTSKFVKRSELEAQRQAAYVAEQARLEAEREERLAKKRKLEEEEAERSLAREEKKRRLAEESRARREEEEARQEKLRRKRLGLPELPVGSDRKEGTPLEDGEEDIAEEELLVKLRELNEPALLFGESHAARLRRYRKLMQRVLTPKMSDGPIPTTLELVKEAEMKVPDSVPAKGTKERDFLFRQLASYFTMVLREWELALARREASVKESYQGKAAYDRRRHCRGSNQRLHAWRRRPWRRHDRRCSQHGRIARVRPSGDRNLSEEPAPARAGRRGEALG